jgi:hypothetical protein
VDRTASDLPFVVDHKTYWCQCASEAEAHFLAAYINSDYANGKIKEFQSRGLFGPRDIHKLIVKIPFPKFDKAIEQHLELSRLGARCAELTRQAIETLDVRDMQARQLGAMRSRIKDILETELQQIDQLVSLLSSGKTDAHLASRKEAKRSAKSAGLFE